MRHRRKWILAGGLAWVAAAPGVRADLYDAPAGYYASVAGLNGAALKSGLQSVIDDHTVVSYNNARYALQMTDQDPTNRDRIILFYDNTPLSLLGLSASGINGWDSGNSWQREHTWPQSRQINASGATTTTGADYSDLHMLRPAGSSNQDRGNANYGGVGTVPGIVSGGYYFPGNAHKGEAARGAFYAAVRYDGSDSSTVNLELQNGNPAANQGLMGDLASLLRYHYEDPVDNAERRRNDLIYRSDNWTNKPTNWNGSASYTQGNRNPFVDHPEFVWSVFGGSANDSRISVAAASGDGSSAKVVDFGRVIVGASVGTLSQPLTISKEGVAPTYYEITTTGGATSSIVGRYNAFSYNAASAVAQVGLTASTATPGLRTGEVRVNNLDLTSSGAGRGSADGDDVVSVQLSVLARSEASWSASANADSATAMFGAVEVGSTATMSVSLHNLVAVAGGAGFTAGLDVDGISLVSVPGSDLFGSAGGAEAFATDLAVSSNLLAGGAITFDVSFTPARSGAFAALLTVLVSDENLPGAGAGTPLTLSLSGMGTAVVPEPGMLGVLVGVGVLGRRRQVSPKRLSGVQPG